jgi:hypothetical protein
MIPEACLIVKPDINFARFVGLSQQALGRSPATKVDSSALLPSETERFLSCLAALRDPHAPVGLSPHLLAHVTFSILVAADERDMFDIIRLLGGMPFEPADTILRDVQLAVITGNLNQWRDCVISGSVTKVEANVRTFFNNVMQIFIVNGLDVWKELKRTSVKDGTFLLTDQR